MEPEFSIMEVKDLCEDFLVAARASIDAVSLYFYQKSCKDWK